MKLQKKLLTLLMVMALAFSAFSVNVFAYTTTLQVSDVRFDNSTISLDPGDTYTLKPIWSPSGVAIGIAGEDYKYSSSNTDVAYVGPDGVIYAYEPGQCTITLKVSYGPSTTASVTVRGTPSSSSNSTITNVSDAVAAGMLRERSSSPSTSSTSKRTTTTSSKSTAIELTGKASREEVVSCAQSNVPVSNYQSVSVESLQAAAGAGAGAVMFDTKTSNNFAGRLTVNTASAKSLTGDLLVGVYAGTGNTQKVQNTFEKSFSNNLKAILCDQKNFGMNVTIAVNIGNMDANNLKFYSYNESTNQYNPLTVSNVKKDSNNFLHFTTSTGGYIIVSDGTLAK